MSQVLDGFVPAAKYDELQAQQLLKEVRNELELHNQVDRGRSYLDKGFDLIWRGDERSQQRLTQIEQQLQQDMKQQNFDAILKMRDEANSAIQKDRKQLGVQGDISMYGGTALKVGALFYGGRAGWGATAGFYALDQAKPGDDIAKQLLDGGMGATKGVATKFLLNTVLDSKLALPLKGGALSIAGRGLDTALTSENYLDPTSGRFSLRMGITATGAEMLNVKHLAVDAAVMGAAYGIGFGVHKFAGSNLANSPFLSRITTSGIAGVSRGAIGEMAAARAAGRPISWKDVGTRAAIMGGVYSIAAVPGAIQADHAIRQAQQNAKQHDGQDNAQGNPVANPDATDAGLREYRKVGTVKAEQLTKPIQWTTSKGEVMSADAGDWKITGGDGSTWSVKPDIFAQTYSEVAGSPGTFAKTAITRATKLTAPITIQTLEGQGSGVAGDYLVVGPKGEKYIVSGAKFESMYRPVEEAK